MGKQIVRQDVPYSVDGNPWEVGKFAIWSTVVDNFVYYDCTKEELVEIYIEEAAQNIRDQVERAVEFWPKKNASEKIELIEELKRNE